MNTKGSIVNAFYALVCRKPFDKLTAQDILDEADVSRSTFYRNFCDKYDLLEYFCDSLIQRITEDIQRQPAEAGVLWLAVLHNLYQNRAFYSALYQTDRAGTYADIMSRDMKKRLGAHLREDLGVEKLSYSDSLMLDFSAEKRCLRFEIDRGRR